MTRSKVKVTSFIQGQRHKLFKVGNPAVFKSYLLRYLQWQLATDHRFLNQGTISVFIGPISGSLQTAFRSVEPCLYNTSMCPTQRQTDKQTYHATCCHMYTMHAMRPNNNNDSTVCDYAAVCHYGIAIASRKEFTRETSNSHVQPQ